jgi:ABC-2 type transport system ATP-binding protein
LIVALARRGKKVILSSHLLADVEDVCSRVVIYYGGKIQAAGTLKELLAEPDTLRITTPVLPRETLERVLETIRKDVSTGEVRVDNPTQNLESYFLDVVQKARAAAAETSGAQSGARVAAYLRAGAKDRPTGEKVLEKLSLPQPAAQPITTPTPAAPKMDERKLEAMAKATAPALAKPAPVSEAKPADLSKADEKLSSLLGGKK